MAEKEEIVTLTRRLEAVLDFLEKHCRKTGEKMDPEQMEKLLNRYVTSEVMLHTVMSCANQRGILSREGEPVPEDSSGMLFVQALVVGRDIFLDGVEAQALELGYGLKDGEFHSTAEVAGMLGISKEHVNWIDTKFTQSLRRRPVRRKKIRDFYA